MPPSGDGGGRPADRMRGPPSSPPFRRQAEMQSPFGGDDNDDATVQDDNGMTMPGDCDSIAYTGAKSADSWRDEGDHTWRWTTMMCLLDRMGGMTMPPFFFLRGIKDHNGGLSLL
jgi:hypothetical protein